MRTLNLQRRWAGRPGAVERAATALRSRGIGKPPLTLLEAEVLAHVSLRQDPWHGVRGRIVNMDTQAIPSGSARGNSRMVSQALQRLARKGFVDRFPLYNITSAGVAALETTFRWALHIRVGFVGLFTTKDKRLAADTIKGSEGMPVEAVATLQVFPEKGIPLGDVALAIEKLRDGPIPSLEERVTFEAPKQGRHR